MAAVLFLIVSILIRLVWPRIRPQIHWLCPVLALALSFCVGGFHTATASLLSAVLLLALLEIRSPRLFLNPAGMAVIVLFAAACVTPLWAADQGMAAFALPRYLPLLLYALFLMQHQDAGQQVLALVPASGCIMTLLSGLGLLLPQLHSQLTVNGRLSGFFQYPNSFAAFLLAGLIICFFTNRSRWNFAATLLLMTGIVLSGSKTVFVLTMLFLTAAILTTRQWHRGLLLGIALLFGLGLGLLADTLALLPNADRFTDIRATSGTFLVRLLYFRDVIPSILSHPFGLGYKAYPAIEGSIQTGRYYVTFIHNGFLQQLLEYGWIPTLFLWGVFLVRVISPRTPMLQRFLLLSVLSHCMMDFDLQFAVFWILILSCLDLQTGKSIPIRSKKLIPLGAALLTAVGLWLGAGDWIYRNNQPDACLALTPFHTEAMTYQLTRCDNPQQLDELADEILSLNPTHSLAFSAKANAAFSRGDIRAMTEYKESAIASDRYTTAEYCDYFQKLYTAMQLYQRSGDSASAETCRKKLLQIPRMMEAVSRKTHALAGMTGDDSTLVLPPEYTALLERLNP